MPIPPKAKLHNKTGKLNTIGQNKKNHNFISSSTNNDTSNAAAPENVSDSSRDSAADCQFELELCWCIQQLETSLNTGKLNEKQAQATEKTLKLLKSSNQPIIKKRQLMRSTFGDYRTKMIDEEKKFSLGAKQIKFDMKSKQKEKSFFIKKSIFMKTGDKNFKFNFQVTHGIEDLNISDDSQNTSLINPGESDIQEKGNKRHSAEFRFCHSENDFKFNFNFE